MDNFDTVLYHFPQNFERLLNSQATLYEWLESKVHCFQAEKLRKTLGAMFFGDQEIRKKIETLSGGEKARLVFASIMLEEHNILILDEPTNHLDMEATDSLIEALKSYSGTVIMVSHNRYFISETADRIIELQERKTVDFQGGYQEFVELHERDYLSEKVLRSTKKTKEKKNDFEERKEEKRKQSRLKKQILACEKRIEKIEAEIEKINHQLAAPQFYEKTSPEEQQVILKQKHALEKEKGESYIYWEQLHDEGKF